MIDIRVYLPDCQTGYTQALDPQRHGTEEAGVFIRCRGGAILYGLGEHGPDDRGARLAVDVTCPEAARALIGLGLSPITTDQGTSFAFPLDRLAEVAAVVRPVRKVGRPRKVRIA